MPLLPFSPAPGLDSDDTALAAQGRWADGNNVRFRAGRAETIGGWQAFTSSALSGICRGLFAYAGPGGTVHLAYGCQGDLYVQTGNAPTSRKGAVIGGATGATGWSFGAFGTTLIACPREGTLYQWTGAGDATEIAAAPDNVRCILVAPERQILAFGCNEELSGAVNRRCIRGCDLEDPTDWTTTSTNNAFEHIVDDAGEIVGARMVGAQLAFWTTHSLFIGQFVGDPAQTWRFDRVGLGSGLIGMNAVAVQGGRAWWLTPDLRFMTWAPGELPAQLPCPIGREFRENCLGFAWGYKFAAAFNSRLREFWLFYADARDASSENSRYVAVNVDDGSWFRGQLARSVALDLEGLSPAAGMTMLAADPAGRHVHSHESGNTANGSALSWHIQSGEQALDGADRRMLVRGFVPDFEAQAGDVALTLYARERPHAAAVTKGPYTMTTATTRKHFRAAGRLVSLKLSGGSASGSFLRMGVPMLDVTGAGER